jgi:hypothetical protein
MLCFYFLSLQLMSPATNHNVWCPCTMFRVSDTNFSEAQLYDMSTCNQRPGVFRVSDANQIGFGQDRHGLVVLLYDYRRIQISIISGLSNLHFICRHRFRDGGNEKKWRGKKPQEDISQTEERTRLLAESDTCLLYPYLHLIPTHIVRDNFKITIKN